MILGWGTAMHGAHRSWLPIVLLCACTVDGNDNDPFGSGTVPGPTTTIAMTTTAATGEESGSESGSTGGEETTGSMTTSTTTGAESTGVDPVGTSGDAASSDDGGPDGMQPQDGMYSHCLTAEECGNLPILCITIGADPDMPTDGFCSEIDCVNAAIDCLPSPGGTATPICMPSTVNNMAEQVCALDCSAGKVCPMPMMCYNLTDIGMVCG